MILSGKKRMIPVAAALMIPAAALTAHAGVSVTQNADSKTGYTVNFTYRNKDATNVQVTGGFEFYKKGDTNVEFGGLNLKDGEDVSDHFVAPEDWKKGSDLVHVNDESYAGDMTGEDGEWTYSVDLPGGYYLYQFNVSYDNGENYEKLLDPDNVPYCDTVGAGQTRSQFYVPYDEEKQDPADDWTFATPADSKSDRGTMIHLTYMGADDVSRPTEIYLPAGYDADREEPYKVLYLSHGGGGDEADWLYQGNAGNVIDRLVAEGKADPFIVVTMNNSVFSWDYDAIFDNTKNYLIPYIEKHYNVSKAASGRAFAGLSMGGMTTSEMYFRDPELFSYFGIFSGSAVFDFPEKDDYADYKKPQLYLAAGYEDMALKNETYQTDSDRSLQGLADKLDEVGISYNDGKGIYVVEGGHDWYTWPQIIKDYVENHLWK